MGSRYPRPFEIHKLIGRYIIGQAIAPMRFKIAGKIRQWNTILFSYKWMRALSSLTPVVFPVFVMIFGPLFGGPKCANWGIHPHIQFYPHVRYWRRHIYTPVQITCHCPGLGPPSIPRFALTQNMVFPILRSWVWTPSTTPVLIHSLSHVSYLSSGKYQCLVDFKLELCRLVQTLDFKVIWAKACAARFALIAVSILKCI